MGLRGGVKLTPPSVSWFSSTPAGIGLIKHDFTVLQYLGVGISGRVSKRIPEKS